MTSKVRIPVVFASTAAAAVIGIGTAGPALAVSPGTQGQPNEGCLDQNALFEPGNAASASGSAFNENGGTAGSVYAGEQPQNSNNPKSVSQYDVACFQVTQQTH